MSRDLKAKNDPENSLKGENGESFARAIDEAFPIEKKPWSDLRGLLSDEEGEEFARVIEEAFPTEPVVPPESTSLPENPHERDRADD